MLCCSTRPCAAVGVAALLLGAVFTDQSLLAAQLSPGDLELQREQRRREAREERLQPAVPDVRLLPDAERSASAYPAEQPCFVIEQVAVEGAERVPLRHQAAVIIDTAVGQCLGIEGIRQLMAQLQNLWVSKGLITTRVLAPAQDLSSGSLRLLVVPGIVDKTLLASGGRINLETAIPGAAGDLLDLRDIEQGLENLQRLPTVRAGVQLRPGELPGETDVVVDWQQERIWRVAIGINDAGSENTGEKQASATLYLDNALGLSDLIYISRGTDLHSNSRYGSDNYIAHFSLPLGYWEIGFTASGYDYEQTVAGAVDEVEYSGTSRRRSLNIGRVVQRSARSKTSVNLALTRRRSRNYIEDVEVEVQRRETAYWELALNNRYFFDRATLDSSLAFRKGTRWFGADPAPEEASGDATALSEIFHLRTTLSVPFELAEQRFRWNSGFFRQWTDTPLTPQDQFTIGGRYTVRGFDGEVSLAADRGWYLQNDIAWLLPNTATELFVGLDYGEVSGKGARFLPGRRLTGAVVGIRGNWKGLSYQLFAGRPVSKPHGFQTDDTTSGIDLLWEY